MKGHEYISGVSALNTSRVGAYTLQSTLSLDYDGDLSSDSLSKSYDFELR